MEPDYFKDCEAKEWVRRYNKKAWDEGKLAAYRWWVMVVHDITRIRGEKASDELRSRMNVWKKTNEPGGDNQPSRHKTGGRL